MILRFRTGSLSKQCRPRSDCSRSSLIRVYTVCHSTCIVWTHYSMVEPHRSNFRVITTNVLGVRIFKKFTVYFLWFVFQGKKRCFFHDFICSTWQGRNEQFFDIRNLVNKGRYTQMITYVWRIPFNTCTYEKTVYVCACRHQMRIVTRLSSLCSYWVFYVVVFFFVCFFFTSINLNYKHKEKYITFLIYELNNFTKSFQTNTQKQKRNSHSLHL